MNPTLASPWLMKAKQNPGARLRLLCFAHAGGSSSMYFHWAKAFGEAIDVCPVELPGHWNRLTESTLMTRMTDLIAAAGPLLLALNDKPMAFFGYSFGGLFAFELARYLRTQGGRLPVALFVGAISAPHLRASARLSHLSDGEFLDYMVSTYGGIPDAILREPELIGAYLPIIRADMEVLETYQYHDEPPLDCPIVAFAGQDDAKAMPVAMQEWERHTTQPQMIHTFAGGHFFIHNHLSSVQNIVARRLTTFV